MTPESYKGAEFVRVYFECDNWYCEKIAIFENEEEYDLCLPVLEDIAKQLNFDFVSEYLGEWE